MTRIRAAAASLILLSASALAQQIPPAVKAAEASIDPEKIAQLKQKMREQGMLPPEEE